MQYIQGMVYCSFSPPLTGVLTVDTKSTIPSTVYVYHVSQMADIDGLATGVCNPATLSRVICRPHVLITAAS